MRVNQAIAVVLRSSVALMCIASVASAQSVPTDSVHRRTAAVAIGFGNAFGGLGVLGEYYLAGSRMSMTAGAGRFIQIDYPNINAFAATLRGYTKRRRHRGFLELSVSPVFVETTISLAGTSVTALYGPGIAAGYHYTAGGGFTLLVNGGIGWSPSAKKVGSVGSIGLGYTWRRR